jgi:hypothetical protein
MHQLNRPSHIKLPTCKCKMASRTLQLQFSADFPVFIEVSVLLLNFYKTNKATNHRRIEQSSTWHARPDHWPQRLSFTGLDAETGIIVTTTRVGVPRFAIGPITSILNFWEVPIRSSSTMGSGFVSFKTVVEFPLCTTPGKKTWVKGSITGQCCRRLKGR